MYVCIYYGRFLKWWISVFTMGFSVIQVAMVPPGQWKLPCGPGSAWAAAWVGDRRFLSSTRSGRVGASWMLLGGVNSLILVFPWDHIEFPGDVDKMWMEYGWSLEPLIIPMCRLLFGDFPMVFPTKMVAGTRSPHRAAALVARLCGFTWRCWGTQGRDGKLFPGASTCS